MDRRKDKQFDPDALADTGALAGLGLSCRPVLALNICFAPKMQTPEQVRRCMRLPVACGGVLAPKPRSKYLTWQGNAQQSPSCTHLTHADRASKVRRVRAYPVAHNWPIRRGPPVCGWRRELKLKPPGRPPVLPACALGGGGVMTSGESGSEARYRPERRQKQ